MEPMAANGTLRVSLRRALVRPAGSRPSPGLDAHDLVFEVRRRDGVWDRECIAEAPTFNSRLHEFEIRREDDDRTWTFSGTLEPDPWVVCGGALRATVRVGDGVATYRSTFGGADVDGQADLAFIEKPRPSRGVCDARPQVLAAFDRDGAASRLFDWSRAGYHYGETPPDEPDLPVLHVRDFGATADSGDEASEGIQAALDAAAAAGGGVVLLDPGVYDVRVDAWRDPLRIVSSRVVLRGAGSGPDGTLIVNHRYADSPEPSKPWLAGQWPILCVEAPKGAERPVARVIEARRGAMSLRVENAADVEPGRTYRLDHVENERGALIAALIGDACEPAANYLKAGVPLVSQWVTVTAVHGDRLTLDLPLHWTLTGDWEAVLVDVPRIREVGVEHLRMRGHWEGHFTHHKSPEHDNGWDHIKLVHVDHGWVRNVVSENTTSAIGLSDTKNCTLSDCRITGNPGHNGYCVGGAATANLLVRMDCERPMHAFNLSGRICGNVLHDCRMSEPAGIDLHGGTGLDTLIDRVTGGVLVGGGSAAAVPPRHAPGLTMWNWCQGHYHPYQAWKRVRRIATWRQTPGFTAVGVHGSDGHRCVYECRDGEAFADRFSAEAWVESNNQAVRPSSLYLYQRQRAAGS